MWEVNFVSHLAWRKNSGERQRSFTPTQENAFQGQYLLRKAGRFAVIQVYVVGLVSFIS